MIHRHGSSIRHKGEAAIAALVLHGSRQKAAEVVGVHPDTIKNWLKDPDFQEAYQQARRVCTDEAQQALRGAMLGSIALLVDFRDDPSKADHLRRQCAVDLLTLGKVAVEGVDLSERLGKLEAMQELLRHELHY